MKTNVQITAVKKEFKNGQQGYEVKVEGMDGKLDCKMNFHEPLKAMRYMFLLSKRLELQIDTVQLAALSLAYHRAKEAEQKAVEDAAQAAKELGEGDEPAQSPEISVEPKEAAPAKSPLLQQYDELKAKHPEALLLFRCGDFYELYREDAVAAAEILGITLTRRSSENIDMAGFPFHALDTYLPKLIRAGKRVAICDQIEAPNTKALVKRNITEMVTQAKPEDSSESAPAENAAPKRRGRKPKNESLFTQEGAA